MVHCHSTRKKSKQSTTSVAKVQIQAQETPLSANSKRQFDTPVTVFFASAGLFGVCRPREPATNGEEEEG
eukprot:1697268-Amphidinium_carterae.1